ncbi:MAG: kynureninase, partial [Acidobacteriota bacterium]
MSRTLLQDAAPHTSEPIEAETLSHHPNPLAEHYRAFDVEHRLLLTGHSHQAWPDVARRGQVAAFEDAAEQVDGKWEAAFEKASRVRRDFARWVGDPPAAAEARYALAANTHELLVRFLSALPLAERPRLVTTDGEFHSMRRQLDRLAETGIEVVRVAVDPLDALADRLAAAIDDRTAAVLVSTVLFRDARRVPGLERAAQAARRHGAEILVDLYHQLGAVPFDLEAAGLGDAFAVGGGYKYLQLGEGNCFLRVPPDRDLRPAVSGWFAEFVDLAATPSGEVAYGRGADAFLGATYDPTSHYRACEVMDFFAAQGLDAERLRRLSQAQVTRLAHGVDALDLDPRTLVRPAVAIDQLGGFLALEAPGAESLRRRLL